MTLQDEMMSRSLDSLDALVDSHIREGVCWFGEDDDWRCLDMRGHHRALAADRARSLKRAWDESQKPGAAPVSYPGRQHLTIKSVLAWEVEPGMVMEHHGKPGSDAITEYVEVISAERCVLTFRRTNDPTGLAFNVTYDPLDSLTVWVVTPVKKKEKS